MTTKSKQYLSGKSGYLQNNLLLQHRGFKTVNSSRYRLKLCELNKIIVKALKSTNYEQLGNKK